MMLLSTPFARIPGVGLLAIVFAGLTCLLEGSQGHATEPHPARTWSEKNLEALLDDYRYLHLHPEVSFQEANTAKYLAEAWRKAGLEVTEKVGGHGIVGILNNGEGSTVMLRTDLDALPVKEQTGLAFASQQTVVTESGAPSGVMHACGHDVHMTSLIGTVRFLAEHRDLWKGRLIAIGQPAEERGAGARAMLDDGLFTRFPKPDFAIALHCEAETPTGKIAVREGYSLANVDSVDITVKGRGGHGSSPEKTIDPIVQAAELVLSLQTIVSREVRTMDAAVVTVGSIHGGTKHNIIGDSCHLQLTVRSYKPEIRALVLAAIERKAKGIAIAYGAPAPEIKVSEGTPALYNDEKLTARMLQLFQNVLGKGNVLDQEPVMGGEDFSQYGLAGVPIVMYRLGVVDEKRLERYKKLGQVPPSLHSAEFYPDVEPALVTGITTMGAAAMELMPAKK